MHIGLLKRTLIIALVRFVRGISHTDDSRRNRLVGWSG